MVLWYPGIISLTYAVLKLSKMRQVMTLVDNAANVDSDVKDDTSNESGMRVNLIEWL
jgi:hypothetical protein